MGLHRLLIIFLLAGLSSVSSCVFDDDTAWHPVTRSAWLIVQDDTTHRLVRLDSTGIVDDWRPAHADLPVLALSGRDQQLWVATATTLYQVDPGTDDVLQTVPLPEITPHEICLGTTALLICDTIRRRVGFYSLRDQHLNILELDAKPRQALYRSLKFYVSTDSQELRTLSEPAQVQLSRYRFDRPVRYLAQDARLSLWVFTGSLAARYRTRIDLNAGIPISAAEADPYEQIRYSPYRASRFGREWTAPVFMQDNGKIQVGDRPQAADYVVDFLENEIFYTWQDTLRVWKQADGTREALIPGARLLPGSFFFTGVAGK
ncbi:MAG: hypothetical protein SF053_02490 [Bacteroidia bacterium]|nr:hypothetical protein [Bacteroidia bacterium]